MAKEQGETKLMAEKVIILKVDLSCELCRKKMEKILKKYQDEWNIKKVKWDTKDNKITLSGPFNTDELIKKLCCKACKTIIEITIPPKIIIDTLPPPPADESLTICLTSQSCHCGPCNANKRQCNCDCSIDRKPCRCNGEYLFNYTPYPVYPPYLPYPPYPPAYGRPTCQFYYEDESSTCAVM